MLCMILRGICSYGGILILALISYWVYCVRLLYGTFLLCINYTDVHLLGRLLIVLVFPILSRMKLSFPLIPRSFCWVPLHFYDGGYWKMFYGYCSGFWNRALYDLRNYMYYCSLLVWHYILWHYFGIHLLKDTCSSFYSCSLCFF